MKFISQTIPFLSTSCVIVAIAMIYQPLQNKIQNLSSRQHKMNVHLARYGIFSSLAMTELAILRLITTNDLTLLQQLYISLPCAWASTSAIHTLISKMGRKKRSLNLDFSLISFLEQIHQKMVSGDSFYKSLSTADNIGNRDITYLQNLIKSGLDPQNCIKLWLDEFETVSKHRLADIFISHSSTAETLALIQNSISWLKSEHKLYLISEIERRNQLVWIPVTIAVLIPGMIFIAIPLEATLKSIFS